MGSEQKKDVNYKSSIIRNYNFTNRSINLNPKIAMAGLILSRYLYEAGTISMSDFSKLLTKGIGLIIKPFTELFFHIIEGYETMIKAEGDYDPDDALLMKDGDHSILSQESFEEILRTAFGIEYQDLCDTDEVIKEVADEAIDDPEFMSHYLSELHKFDKGAFPRLRRLAEDNPEKFVNFPFYRKHIACNTPQEPPSVQIDEEHLFVWLSLYSILRAVLKDSEPRQEALHVKAEMLERRLKREGLLKDEIPEQSPTVE